MIRRTLLVTAALGASLLGPGVASGATLFTLNGHGWGHGIGMSQYGALGYAQHGWTHQQILQHYFTGTTIGQLPSGTKERVLLISSRPSIHLSFTQAATGSDQAGTSRSLPAGSYRVDPGTVAGQLRLWSKASGKYVWKGIVSPLQVAPHGGPLQLDDSVNGFIHDHWWGDFRIDRSGGSLSLVDVVGMERYVSGVVPCEMPASWLPEAVQAQAVAARSYAVATAGGGTFDAYADTRSQMYCPVEHQVAASDAAVAATKHQVVKYGGQVAATFFSSSSGGRTSSLAASWGSTNQPYLVPVRDRYDGADGLNPNHTWAPRVFSPSALGSALGVGGSVSSLDTTIDGPSQRVLSVLVHSGGGDHSLTAGDVFSRLGLRSTYFRILQVTLAAPKSSTAGDAYHLKGRLWPRPKGAFRLESKSGRLRQLAAGDGAGGAGLDRPLLDQAPPGRRRQLPPGAQGRVIADGARARARGADVVEEGRIPRHHAAAAGRRHRHPGAPQRGTMGQRRHRHRRREGRLPVLDGGHAGQLAGAFPP